MAESRIRPLRSGGLLWGPDRLAAGISLNALAERTGIAKGDLSRFESGRMNPRLDEIKRVLAALDELVAEAGPR